MTDDGARALLPPGALPLPNPKQEAFAVARARGLSLTLAYREAGYTGGQSNASHAAQKEHIKQRIEYLKGVVVKTARNPEEAWDAALKMEFPRELTLTYYLTDLKQQLALCRLKGDLSAGIRCLYLIGAASGLIKLQPPGRPPKSGAQAGTKRGREAQEDHDGERQQRTPSAPADGPEDGLSEVFSFVDAMRSGPRDEFETEDPTQT